VRPKTPKRPLPRKVLCKLEKFIAAVARRGRNARVFTRRLADVTVLRAPRSLAPWSRGGRLELLALYFPGRLAVVIGLRNAFRGLGELLREALRLARPGSVLVADAELSSKACLRVLLEALGVASVKPDEPEPGFLHEHCAALHTARERLRCREERAIV